MPICHVTYYVALIGCRSIFPGSVETRPIITAQWSGLRLTFWLELWVWQRQAKWLQTCSSKLRYFCHWWRPHWPSHCCPGLSVRIATCVRIMLTLRSAHPAQQTDAEYAKQPSTLSWQLVYSDPKFLWVLASPAAESSAERSLQRACSITSDLSEQKSSLMMKFHRDFGVKKIKPTPFIYCI